MKKTIIYFLFLLFPLAGNSQTWKWERKIASYEVNTPVITGILSNIVVDKAGNSYMLFADSSVYFNGNSPAIIGAPGLVKISPDGNLIWQAPIHISGYKNTLLEEIKAGTFNNWGAITIAPNGHIVVCDDLPDTLTFSNIILPGSVGFNGTLATTQLFLAECDTSGTWIQAHSIGTTTSSYLYLTGIVFDKNSNVFVNGTFFNSLVIGKVSYSPNNMGTPGSVFLGSFKMDGSINWVDNFPNRYGSEYPNRNDLCVDPNGNLYFAASCANTSQKNDSIFIYKIRANGNLTTIKTIPDSDGENVDPVHTVKSDNSGNIYLAGSLKNTVDFGGALVLKAGSDQKAFLIKYDSSFNPKWLQTLNGNGDNAFDNFCIDASDNIYTIGNIDGQVRVGDSVYTGSAFIVEYDPNGKIVMGVVTIGFGDNLTLDSFNNLITDGYFFGSIQFDCDTLNGGTDYNYIAKLDPRPPDITLIPFCTGDSLICTSDTSLYHNFIWKFRDGTVLSGRKVAYNNPPAGMYTFGLYAINSVGCQVFVKDSFIHPPPPVAAFSTIDSIACEYTKLILNDISKTDTIAPGNWPQDNWSFGDGTTSNSNKMATKIYTDTGTFIIKLIYNNGFCATDTSMNIRVIPAPKTGFTVSDSAGCPPLTVKITPQTSGAITHTQYDFGNGQKDTSAPSAVVYSMSGNYKILQQLTGPTGCITEDSANIHVRAAFSPSKATDIANVTVVDSPLSLASQWLLLPGASVYNLYRYVDQDSSAATIIAQTQYNKYFDSNNIDPDAHTYTYYLTVSDSCGNTTTHGRIARSIRLTGTLDNNLNPKLQWNPYLDWPKGVSGYAIFRKNSSNTFVQIAQTSDTVYIDTGFLANAVYDECYRIMAYDSFESNSNIFCFGNAPQIFVPNIFTPNGDSLNDLFTPVFSGIKSWRMDVLNRWGERVYSSASPQPSPKGEGESGWDGNFKGQPASQGVYIYDIKATDYNGNTVSKQGTVILQR